jgi:hypothetical protein
MHNAQLLTCIGDQACRHPITIIAEVERNIGASCNNGEMGRARLGILMLTSVQHGNKGATNQPLMHNAARWVATHT